jgi:hypothetical protein
MYFSLYHKYLNKYKYYLVVDFLCPTHCLNGAYGKILVQVPYYKGMVYYLVPNNSKYILVLVPVVYVVRYRSI